MITVMIPVGPNPIFKEYLPEAIESVFNQTTKVDEILIIDDGAEIDLDTLNTTSEKYYQLRDKISWDVGPTKLSFWKSPCNIGFTAAHNIGMAIADNDLVIYLASDDKLLSHTVEATLECYEQNNKKDAWYAYTYQLSTGESCHIPMNAAMITKGLWKMVGGYPPSGFVGPDALVLSILMKHAPDRIIKVRDGEPLYWHRVHDQQETKTHSQVFSEEMTSIRHKETQRFKFKC